MNIQTVLNPAKDPSARCWKRTRRSSNLYKNTNSLVLFSKIRDKRQNISGRPYLQNSLGALLILSSAFGLDFSGCSAAATLLRRDGRSGLGLALASFRSIGRRISGGRGIFLALGGCDYLIDLIFEFAKVLAIIWSAYIQV